MESKLCGDSVIKIPVWIDLGEQHMITHETINQICISEENT